MGQSGSGGPQQNVKEQLATSHLSEWTECETLEELASVVKAAGSRLLDQGCWIKTAGSRLLYKAKGPTAA
ncbi:hypothetical protein WJX79_010109 [Trebouxia sp. C0005]